MSAPAAANAWDLQHAHSHAALAKLPEPKSVFKHLLMCLETPRPSNEPGVNHLEAITNKLLAFGAHHKLDCAVDAAGNVRLRAPASVGYESATKIVVQSHLDVVCSKSNDKVHDFTKDFVTPIVEGNVLRADRTTLGADDGIGVAASMALFEEGPEFVHGPLEAVFTVDEETDMGGAERISKDLLQSTVLINVDSEESESICVGCAGGFEKQLFLPLPRFPLSEGAKLVRVHLHSLLGGHTGIDIAKGRANALILAARLISAALEANVPVHLVSLAGGNAPNAIPRDATFTVMLPSVADVEGFKSSLAKTFARMQQEFVRIERKLLAGSDNQYAPCMVLDVTELENIESPAPLAVGVDDTRRCVALMQCLPHGPIKTNIDLNHAVDTSISFSLASLVSVHSPNECVAHPFMMHLFARSSSEGDMIDVDSRLASLALLAGCTTQPRANYFPGWEPQLDSPALKQVIATHKQLFEGKEPKVYSVHAGLECGLFKLAYPSLDCVSIGPTIHHAHSPDECLVLDTVEPFYRWLKSSITNIAKDSLAQKQ